MHTCFHGSIPDTEAAFKLSPVAALSGQILRMRTYVICVSVMLMNTEAVVMSTAAAAQLNNNEEPALHGKCCRQFLQPLRYVRTKPLRYERVC